MITAMAAKKCYKLLITALLFLMNATGGWKEYYRAIAQYIQGREIGRQLKTSNSFVTHPNVDI